MKTAAVLFASLAVTALGPSATAQANNNLFLPGDAFFPTVITEADIQALQAREAGGGTFVYSSFDGYGEAFCGYAGYNKASIPSIDKAFANNLATVCSRIQKVADQKAKRRGPARQDPRLEAKETRVLFYPPEFEFPRYRVGLRYNENWAAEAARFGHSREHLRLCCLIDDPDAVEISWRDAELVRPLNVELPDVEPVPVPKTEATVVVQGNVKAFVIGSQTLKELFRSRTRDTLTLFVVDSDGIAEWVYAAGSWKRRESK